MRVPVSLYLCQNLLFLVFHILAILTGVKLVSHPWIYMFLVNPACCRCITSVMSDSVRPHRQQPTSLPRPWDSPGKNTGVGCHFLLKCMKVKSESEVAQSCTTLRDPMDCSLPGSSAHGGEYSSRQEYWSRVPLPSPSETSLAASNYCSLKLFSSNQLLINVWLLFSC